MSYNEKKERLIYIDIIKIIAIFGVILIHTCSKHWYSITANSNKWEAMNLWNLIGRFGVACFVMCSGILFLNKKEISYKELIYKYCSRLVISFGIWVFIYAIIQNRNGLTGIFTLLKNGIPEGHLWFIIMIIGIYLVMPIIRIFIKGATKKDIEYFLLIAFIIQSVIPFLMEFKTFSWINNYYTHLNPTVITGYIGYFVLGYYLNKYELSKKKKTSLMVLGIISIIITILLNLFKSQKINEPLTTFFNNFYPNIVFYSIGMFLIIKEICSKIRFGDKLKDFIAVVGKNIFGVYLIHILIRDLLDLVNINALMYNTYISIPLVSLLIFMISLIVTYIISKIPYLRRIVL